MNQHLITVVEKCIREHFSDTNFCVKTLLEMAAISRSHLGEVTHNH